MMALCHRFWNKVRSDFLRPFICFPHNIPLASFSYITHVKTHLTRLDGQLSTKFINSLTINNLNIIEVNVLLNKCMTSGTISLTKPKLK